MNDYAQLLSLITGGQQTPADIQPTQQGWLQWLLNAKSGGGMSSPGGTGNASGLGSALMGNMGGGATSAFGKGLISGL